MALAPTTAWLIVGRVISGMAASSVSTAGAYIADVTPPEARAAGFGLMGVSFGLGFVLGPAVGGLLGAGDPRRPFWGAAQADRHLPGAPYFLSTLLLLIAAILAWSATASERA